MVKIITLDALTAVLVENCDRAIKSCSLRFRIERLLAVWFFGLALAQGVDAWARDGGERWFFSCLAVVCVALGSQQLRECRAVARSRLRWERLKLETQRLGRARTATAVEHHLDQLGAAINSL